MGRGFLAGIFWGGIVGVGILAVSSQVVERQQLSLPRPEATAVEVPAGSEFDRARAETDPVVPEEDERPMGEALTGVTPPDDLAETPPAFDTSSLDMPEPATGAPGGLGALPETPNESDPGVTGPGDSPQLSATDAGALPDPDVPGDAPERQAEAPDVVEPEADGDAPDGTPAAIAADAPAVEAPSDRAEAPGAGSAPEVANDAPAAPEPAGLPGLASETATDEAPSLGGEGSPPAPALEVAALDTRPGEDAPPAIGRAPEIATDAPSGPALSGSDDATAPDAPLVEDAPPGADAPDEPGRPEGPGAAPVETAAPEAPEAGDAPAADRDVAGVEEDRPAAPGMAGDEVAILVPETAEPPAADAPADAPEAPQTSDAPAPPASADDPAPSGATAADDALRPGLGTAPEPGLKPVRGLPKVIRLTESDDEGAASPAPDAAGEPPDGFAVSENAGALLRWRQPFDAATAAAFSVILLHEGPGLPEPKVVQDLPRSIAFAVDAARPDAADIAAAYRNADREVILIPSLPRGGRPQDVEVALRVNFDTVPEAVAIMDLSGGVFQSDRAAVKQVIDAVVETGHGLITFPRGLNTAHRIAEQEGVPTGLIFRDIDGDGETREQIMRAMDRAAFRARQDREVILVGRTRPDTFAALGEWMNENAGSDVALAPVSTALLQDD